MSQAAAPAGPREVSCSLEAFLADEGSLAALRTACSQAPDELLDVSAWKAIRRLLIDYPDIEGWRVVKAVQALAEMSAARSQQIASEY